MGVHNIAKASSTSTTVVCFSPPPYFLRCLLLKPNILVRVMGGQEGGTGGSDGATMVTPTESSDGASHLSYRSPNADPTLQSRHILPGDVCALPRLTPSTLTPSTLTPLSGANAGLGIIRDMLIPVSQKNPNVSKADIWCAAGALAIEQTGGPKCPVAFCAPLLCSSLLLSWGFVFFSRRDGWMDMCTRCYLKFTVACGWSNANTSPVGGAHGPYIMAPHVQR